MNSITNILDLEDNDIFIQDITTEGSNKIITVSTHSSSHFCPLCGFKMYSRGLKTRTINHPILQDSYHVIIKLKQRRWRCTNKQCMYTSNEEFNFVSKRKRNTNATDMLIINSFRDISLSAVSIASKFNVSDTYVLDTFDRYVKMPRLPLSDIISVDEVHLEIDPNCKYALVIQDFYSGDPIDLLITRRNYTTEPYFTSIPLSERLQVRYLISDMYNPYIQYVNKYFPNAVSVVDAFHVIQWITHKIDLYIRDILKNLQIPRPRRILPYS